MPIDNEQLKEWKNEFGKDYTDRNHMTVTEMDSLYKKNYGISRTDLNKEFLKDFDKKIKILEIGSNIGNQLLCLQNMGFKNLYGLEPQLYAIELSKKQTRHINIIEGNAFDIPFKDKYFDLVFTSGVLIHINPENIDKALDEIYRCSNSFIWGFEYYIPKGYEMIQYREKEELLWKTDFSKLFLDRFPDLILIKKKNIRYTNSENEDLMYLLKKGN